MIKLKDLLKEDTLPKVLYHNVTSEHVRDSIIANGIRPNDEHMIYLSTKPITRAPYKYTFEVRIPDSNYLYDWRDIWSDSTDKEYDEKNPYYIYHEKSIPKEYVKLI